MAETSGQVDLISRLTFRHSAAKEGPAPTSMALTKVTQPVLAQDTILILCRAFS